MAWLVLGFSADEVIVAWQDARLACECVQAWQAAGKPADFAVLQTGGQGEHLLNWFVSPAAAALLEKHGCDFKRFVIGHADEVPAGAKPALTEVGELRGDRI